MQLKKNPSEFSPIWPNQLGNGRCSIQGPISTDHSMQYVEPLESTVSAKKTKTELSQAIVDDYTSYPIKKIACISLYKLKRVLTSSMAVRKQSWQCSSELEELDLARSVLLRPNLPTHWCIFWTETDIHNFLNNHILPPCSYYYKTFAMTMNNWTAVERTWKASLTIHAWWSVRLLLWFWATVLPKSVSLWVSVQTLCLHFYGPFLRDRKHWLCTLTEQREDSTISRGVDKLWQDWHTDL